MFDENVDRQDESPRGGKGRAKAPVKKRIPAFLLDDEYKFDYKDPQNLRYFLTDRGKIVPRRVSGLSAKKQRELTVAVKRARNIALLPYTTLR